MRLGEVGSVNPLGVAAEALGRIGSEARAAVPALVEALKDDDWLDREHAANALWRIAPDGVRALIAAFKGDEAIVREAAGIGLGGAFRGPDESLRGTGFPEAKATLPVLIAALKDNDADIRMWAVGVLGRIGSEGVPALTDALEDEDANVREHAADALAAIDPEALLRRASTEERE